MYSNSWVSRRDGDVRQVLISEILLIRHDYIAHA